MFILKKIIVGVASSRRRASPPPSSRPSSLLPESRSWRGRVWSPDVFPPEKCRINKQWIILRAFKINKKYDEIINLEIIKGNQAITWGSLALFKFGKFTDVDDSRRVRPGSSCSVAMSWIETCKIVNLEATKGKYTNDVTIRVVMIVLRRQTKMREVMKSKRCTSRMGRLLSEEDLIFFLIFVWKFNNCSSLSRSLFSCFFESNKITQTLIDQKN